jgi:phage-related protein
MARNEVRVVITGDADRLRGAFGQAEAQAQAFSDRMRDIGSKMRDVGQSMTLGITLPIAAGLGLGVKWAGELEDAQAMSQQVFGSISGDMERWAENSAQAFGLSRGEAIEWANQMGIRLRQIGGLSEEQAGMVSANLVQLAGDFASAFGGSVDEAAQAIGSALTGEFEPLKRYGIVINDAALKNKLFQLTGENVSGTLTAQQKQMATLALITEQSALVQGDYGRNADGATNSQRTMIASLKDAATTLGTVLLPFITKAAQFISDLADRFQGLSPTMQKVIVIGALVAAAIGPIIYVAGGLATAIGLIATPVGLVVAAIVALVGGLIYLYKTNDGFRQWVDNLVSNIRDKLAVAFEWFKAEVVPRLVEAFNWVKDVAIPALVAAFGWARDNVLPVLAEVGALVAAWAQFMYDKVSGFIEAMMPVWSAVWTAVVAVVQFLFPIVKAVVETVLKAISGAIRFVTAILNGDWRRAWDMVLATVRGAWQWILGVVRGGVDWVLGILRGAAGAIGGALTGAWQWMVGVAQGGINQVVGVVASLWGRVTGALSGAGSWLIDAGRRIIDGLVRGIEGAIGRVRDILGRVTDLIPDWKGPPEKDRRLLRPTGRLVMTGFSEGLAEGANRIVRPTLGNITAALPSAATVRPAGVVTAGGSTGPTFVFQGPVARDAESWLLDVFERAQRRAA